MAITIEAYTAGGIVGGRVPADGRLRDLLESGALLPFDDGVDPDDLLAVVDTDAAVPVHASLHRVRLGLGPYVIEGDFATLPGFDPGRALSRPSGTFVSIHDAVVRVADDPAAGSNAHRHLLVNRYAVESVEADLMLAFFFPGAAVVGNPAGLPPPTLGV